MPFHRPSLTNRTDVVRGVAVDPTNAQCICLGMGGSDRYSGPGEHSWLRATNVLSAEDDVIRKGSSPLDPRNIYAAVGWSDGFRLVIWDPAAVEMEWNSPEEW